MLKKLNLLFIILILTCSASAGENFVKIPGPLKLKNNDTFVFLGDSITHQSHYTQYIEDYFYTRMPNKKINFVNAGVSGDVAADALKRFDVEVARYKPKYVSILLGMNDGRYRHFDHKVFQEYEKGMTQILDKIKAIGAEAIPMTPTMFDSRYDSKPHQIKQNWMTPDQVRTDYYNSVLAFYGTWLREQALYRGLRFVDMYAPLNRITVEQRKFDQNFSFISDAVHPSPNGQLVMALAMLKDLNATNAVSEITLYVDDLEWNTRAKGGKVSKLKTKVPGFFYLFQAEMPIDYTVASFTFTAKALPWVVPDQANLGYRIANAASIMSKETFTLTGLPSIKNAKLQLRIDGQTIGTYTLEQLAKGIELQSNTKTPQYQQALRVANLNKERNDKAIRKLRDQWWAKKEMKRKNIETTEPEKYKRFLEKQKEDAIEFNAIAKDYEEQIYKANKPKPLLYEIVVSK